MEAISFEEANIILGEGQPQYVPLPAHIDREDSATPMTCCFKLSPEEIEEIQKTGVIWLRQLTFGTPFHPIWLGTNKPF